MYILFFSIVLLYGHLRQPLFFFTSQASFIWPFLVKRSIFGLRGFSARTADLQATDWKECVFFFAGCLGSFPGCQGNNMFLFGSISNESVMNLIYTFEK